MARHAEQAQLPLVTQRTALLELEDEEFRVRLPTKVAQAVANDPAAAVKALAAAGEKMLADITAQNKPIGQTLIDGKLVPESPNAAGAHAGWPANEDPSIYSPWFTEEAPYWKGFYDVTDHKTGTLNARWWFGGVWWYKGDPSDIGHRGTALTHDDFKKQYAWRGGQEGVVDKNWPYTNPPYNIAELPPGVPFVGKYIRRAALE